MDFRPILVVVGKLLAILGLAMGFPVLADLMANHRDWQVFLMCAGGTVFIGVMLVLTNHTKTSTISVRQAFMVTALAWLVLSAFAALPFYFSDLDISYTDAFFEAMSGITTTGSTIMVALEHAPPGILLWRSLLQWLGGIGIVVMAISVLPILQVGGMQLFRMEFADSSEKIFPRVNQITVSISVLYFFLTLTCAGLYFLVGMPWFDAINHAMTTVATGGYSTKDVSIGSFNSAAIDSTATLFMILGSLPFLLFFQMVRGHGRSLFQDDQVKWFFAILAFFVALVIWLLIVGENWPFWTALRHGMFNVVSVMTGTGYATMDYGTWGAFAMPIFFLLMFVGGCAGSTTCGIKVFRFQVLFETMRVQIRKLQQPHGVFLPYYNGKPMQESVTESVTSFFFIYISFFGVISLLLGILGLDFITATSAAASAIGNVGPGLGPIIGPAGNFSSLPDMAKWVLAFGMLLGRLEFFTILILLAPHFWKN